MSTVKLRRHSILEHQVCKDFRGFLSLSLSVVERELQCIIVFYSLNRGNWHIKMSEVFEWNLPLIAILMQGVLLSRLGNLNMPQAFFLIKHWRPQFTWLLLLGRSFRIVNSSQTAFSFLEVLFIELGGAHLKNWLTFFLGRSYAWMVLIL